MGPGVLTHSRPSGLTRRGRIWSVAAYILTLILAAFAAFGAPVQPVFINIQHWDTGALAGGGCREPERIECEIVVDEARFAMRSPHEQANIIAHEVGHVLGLEHASCNPIPNAMGCGDGSWVTDYDRAKYRALVNPAHRAVMSIARD